MADVIPYQSLRTSHLFSGAGDNPLGINSQARGYVPDPIEEYRRKTEIDQNVARVAHIQQIADEARHRAQNVADVNSRPNNVVLGQPPINPLQAANLALKQQQEQGKNDRADESLQSREKLAGNALQEKQQYGQTVNNIRQQMASIADFKSKHPNVQFYSPKGGTLHYYDPSTQKMVDTGVDSGSMTQEDASNLGLENQLKEIGARGDQSRETLSQSGQQGIDAIAARGAQQRTTNAAKTTTHVQSAADKKTQYFNKAQNLMNDPTYSKYVKRGDKAGEFTIEPETPQDMYHNINAHIYGGGSDIELPAENKPAPVEAPKSKYKVTVEE